MSQLGNGRIDVRWSSVTSDELHGYDLYVTAVRPVKYEFAVPRLSADWPFVEHCQGPDPRHFSPEAPAMVSLTGGRASVYLSTPADGRTEAELRKEWLLTTGGRFWLVPRLGGAAQPPHELGLWWSLLFALSMRARYEPEGWTSDLDPDRSAHAVPLETVLDAAVTYLPAVVAGSIRT